MLFKVVTVITLLSTSCKAGFLDSVTSWWKGDTNSSKPSFCNSLDCPRFKVIESTDEYEVRNYNYPTNWVSTTATDFSMEDVKKTMFWRLFKYISRGNSREEKIDMTVPVTTLVSPGHGPACESNFTMSFFIADSITNPPTPNNPDVFLRTMPVTTVYVRSFGGYASEQTYLDEARALARALPSRLPYKRGPYYTVGYDAPYKFWNRHNEIWFIASQ